MAQMTWTLNPHAGGTKIPEGIQRRTEDRIRAYAEKHYAGKYTRLEFRFRGALCYIDAYTEPEDPTRELLRMRGETKEQYLEFQRNLPLHLARLRYFRDDVWSMAFFTYSHEKYEPCIFNNGSFFGTCEEAFETAAVYLE